VFGGHCVCSLLVMELRVKGKAEHEVLWALSCTGILRTLI